MTMNKGLVTKSAYAAGIICVATGILYSVVAASGVEYEVPPGILVLGAALVGGISLIVVGVWQGMIEIGNRGLPLATLSALAGLYTLANLAGTQFPELHGWRAMFYVGLVAGAGLFVIATGSLLEDQRARTSSNGQNA
jgi:hypothetical protein